MMRQKNAEITLAQWVVIFLVSALWSGNAEAQTRIRQSPAFESSSSASVTRCNGSPDFGPAFGSTVTAYTGTTFVGFHESLTSTTNHEIFSIPIDRTLATGTSYVYPFVARIAPISPSTNTGWQQNNGGANSGTFYIYAGATACAQTQLVATVDLAWPGDNAWILRQATFVASGAHRHFTYAAASQSSSTGSTYFGIDDATQLLTDLAITKTDGSDTYTPGTNVVYTIVVSNNGPDNATGARVTDPLPAGITTASWTCGGATGGGVCGAASGSGAINTTANLPAGASVTYSMTLNVPSSFTGSLTNTATVAAPAAAVDANTANNSASDTDSQFPPPPPNVANLTCLSDASLLNTAYDGTGGKLTSGNDTHWQVALTTTPITGTPPAGLNYNTAAVVANPPGLYMVSPYDNANWISHAADALHPTNANYDIFYRYQLNLGPGTDPTTLAPRLDFYSDNSVIEIWVNGVAQNIQSSYGAADPYFYAGFTAANPAAGTLTGPWNSGFNEIVVHVKSGPGAQAFLAQVVLPQSICQPATVTLNKATRLVTGGPFGFGLTNTAQATGSVSTITVDAPAQVDGDTSSAGTAEPFAVTTFGTDVVITENALPAGWLLSDAVCTSGGTPVGGRSGSTYTIPGSLIDASAESFVCMFTNSPTTNLRIDKTANPTTLRPGEAVIYTIVVNNDGPGPGDDAVVADPAIIGVDCAAATLSCSASDGAACPASLDVSTFQDTGLTIPTFPAGGSLQFGMTCTVTATGQ